MQKKLKRWGQRKVKRGNKKGGASFRFFLKNLVSKKKPKSPRFLFKNQVLKQKPKFSFEKCSPGHWKKTKKPNFSTAGFGKKTRFRKKNLKIWFLFKNLVFFSKPNFHISRALAMESESWRASVKSANTRRTRLPVVLTHESADTISPTLLNTLMSYVVSHTLSPTLVCCLTGRKPWCKMLRVEG